VKKFIGESPNVIFHKGYFPDTADAVKDIRFAFVNMDADLHNPTKAGLEFFYPRLSPGGIILIHDYNADWPELMNAVDTFCSGIAESPVPVPDADSSLMIVKSK
jgi:O-methyltransferase